METLLVVYQHRNEYHYNGRGRMNGNGNGNGGRCGSSPSRGCGEINCRIFESGTKLVPDPFTGFGSPELDQTLESSDCSGKVVSDEGKKLERIVSNVLLTPNGRALGGGGNEKMKSEGRKMVRRCVKSSPISINANESCKKERFVREDLALGGGCNGKMKSDEGKMLKKYVKSSPISINSNGSGNKERFVREDLALSELWAAPAYSNSPPSSSLPIPKFSMKPTRTVSPELRELETELSLPPMAKSAPASLTREFVGPPGGFGGGVDDFATKSIRRILSLDIADD